MNLNHDNISSTSSVSEPVATVSMWQVAKFAGAAGAGWALGEAAVSLAGAGVAAAAGAAGLGAAALAGAFAGGDQKKKVEEPKK